jgi:hypothetical protein
LRAVFIDDINKGYTPSRLVRYYKSNKEEDIQTIMVNWFFELPAPNNPNRAEHPSLDPRSLYQAIKTRLDWGRLEKLLMPSP